MTATIAPVTVPNREAFGDAEFLESRGLEDMGRDLVESNEELQWLIGYRVRYLWKAKGGGGEENAVLGKTTVPSGIAKYFSLTDYVVWLAADHCRRLEFTDDQIAALMYHELCHCTLKGTEADIPGIRKHDFEGFNAEVEKYGAWNDSLVVTKAAFG